ncbi:hypothetical protein [Paenibacillus sp. NEAU-GSW1]|uniref:hypothetical protein n=1 Tax=Paenibacillus sp. NEAU-GSW1 TaxID=2682486 RepID=UPI0012E11A13|nr:hypothetical protein [Paenibacillus sp. NEAU-GSW1]MUT67690.1 hypothetical protein [Paenibacillus sp. NEAU-GSW1]
MNRSSIEHLPELRLDGRGVISKTLSLFFRNAGALLLIAAVTAVPVEIIKNYAYFWGDREAPASLIADTFVSAVFLSLLTPVVVYYLIGKMRDGSASVWASYMWGVRKWPRIIVYHFLQGVIVTAGLILLVVPGLLMLTRTLLLPVVVSAENTSVMNPLEVGRNMSIGRFWPFLGYVVLFTAAGFAAFYGISEGLSFILPDERLAVFIYDVLMDYLYLVYTVLLTVIYLHIKTVQKDSEVAANEINDSDENRMD